MIPSAPSVLQKGLFVTILILLVLLLVWTVGTYFWYKPRPDKPAVDKDFEKWLKKQKAGGRKVVLIQDGKTFRYEKFGQRFGSPEKATEAYWRAEWERAQDLKTAENHGFVVLSPDEYEELGGLP